MLESKDFKGLLGITEDEHLDFKLRYDLDDPKGIRDLIADVAAFANEGGGIIVIGAIGKKDETSEIEYCVAVSGVEPPLVADRVLKLLRQHARPPVKGVKLHTFTGPSTRNDKTVTAQVVEVGPAREEDSPVIVERFVSEQGEAASHAFGWPVRHGDGTEWEDLSRIQQLLNVGLRPSTRWPVDFPPLPPADDQLDDKDGWADWGRLVLRLVPRHANAIADFHTAFRDYANSEWHDLRPMSFGFRLTGITPLVNKGGALVAETPRDLLRIESHGQVTSAALASPRYLGWAQHKDDPGAEHLDQLVINPYPFLEFCAETVRLAYDLVGPFAEPSEWQLNGGFEHLRDRVSVALKLDTEFGPVVPAVTDEVNETLESRDDWQHDTYRLIDALVAPAFGIRADDIALVGDGVVDPSSWPSR